MTRRRAKRVVTPARCGLIRLIGSPLLLWEGQSLPLPAKAFGVIALLTTEPSRSLPRHRIRDCLWGEFPQEKASANLRQTLARVRKIEQEKAIVILNVDGDRITLNSEQFDIDLITALAINVLELSRNGDWLRLERFVELTSGRLLFGIELPDSPFANWHTEVQDRLERATILALSALIEGIGDDQLDQRQRLAQKLLQVDPTQELGYRTLMETYDAQGQRGLALQAYRRCRDVLREELRTGPESATRRLALSLGFADVTGTTVPPSAKRGEKTSVGADPGSELPRDGTAGVPRIILLPPLVVAEDQAVAGVAAALVEDVISGLTRCRSFTVLAPHTSLQIAPGGIKRTNTDTRLNIGYAVNTTIKPTSPSWAVTFRLTKCETSAVLWVTELDFHLDRLPLLFSRLSHQVIYSLADTIERTELRFPFAARNSTAYRLYLEGRAAMSDSDLPNLRRARLWYRKSLDEFGSYAPAIAGLSRTMSMERLVRGLTDDTMLREALALGKVAAELDPFDGRGLRECGFSSLYLKRHDESLYNFEMAAALNPNDADLLADYADALAHAGQPERARDMCSRAIDLNPLGPDYYYWILGSIHYQLGDYNGAITILDRVRHHPATARLLAASLAMAGHSGDARRFAAVVRENYPDFRLANLARVVPDKFTQDTQHLYEGLRLAGLD